jgi:hypothetical protein
MAIGIAMVSTAAQAQTAWRPLAPWPDPRLAVSAASVGSKLYLIRQFGSIAYSTTP